MFFQFSVFIRYLLLLLLLPAGAFTCFSQKIQFRNFNVKEGLAQSQVYDIVTDNRGRLWMATRGGGVSIYDGLGFTTFNHKNGLSNDFVYCFLPDVQQHLWIGTNDGLNYYDGRNVTRYYPKELGGQVGIQKIVADKRQRLWLATSMGLLQFEKGVFRNITKEQRLQRITCNTVFLDHDSLLYFGNDYGLFRLNLTRENARAEKIRYSNTDPSISITCLVRNAKNELLAGSYGYGLFRVEGDRLLRYLDTMIDRQEKILDLYADREDLYIATMEKGVLVYNYRSHRLEATDEKKGLSGNHVRKIYKDRNGNFWYGTSGSGISYFGGQLFTHFDRQSGLPDNFVYAVYQAEDRSVWAGCGNKGIVRMTADSLTIFNASNGFIQTKVKVIRPYRGQSLLIGTEGDGLYIRHDSIFEQVTALGRQFIKDIQTTPDGNIWIATAGNGIYRLKPQGAGLTDFDIRQFVDHIINRRIQFLNTQIPGKVFYCTETQGIGLIEQERESSLRLNVAAGIGSNLTRSMSITTDGLAWIATSDKGVSVYDLNRRKPVPFNNTALSSLNIYLLQPDKKGNLVLGTERGLEHVILDRQRQVWKVKHYGKGDGFLGIETCLNAISANTDGSYWIGTIDGLTLYSPSKGAANNVAPVLSLTDIRLFYTPLAQTAYKEQLRSADHFDPLLLPHNQNHLTFDFMGVNLSNGEGVQYKWKLEPFDAGWSPASQQHTATYSNLPSGTYTLLVNACNEDGVWNSKPLRYTFEIKKPFWKEGWFIVPALLLIIVAVYRVIHWRIRSIQKEAAEKQHELELQNQLQRLEHKALRLQMNPHFIFNALNSIQSQIGNNNDQEARYYMAKFGKLMRQILQHSEQAWIDINEELAMIENYLLLEQFCNNKQFDYEVRVPAELLEEDYKIPPMILQPFIENAIKHGFKGLQERRARLLLEMQLSEEGIVCTITDNGRGRASSSKEPSAEAHQSMAIGITKKRLQILHKNSSKDFVEITDLEADGVPTGTSVSIVLPFQ